LAKDWDGNPKRDAAHRSHVRAEAGPGNRSTRIASASHQALSNSSKWRRVCVRTLDPAFPAVRPQNGR